MPRGHRPDGTCCPRGQVRGRGTAGCESPPRDDPRCIPETETAGASPAGLTSLAELGVAVGSFPERCQVEHPAFPRVHPGWGQSHWCPRRSPFPIQVSPPRLGAGQTRLAGDDLPSRSPSRVPEDKNIASRGPAGGSIPGWPPARARKAEPSPSETHSGTVAAIADAPAGRRPHHSPAEREPHVHMGRNSSLSQTAQTLNWGPTVTNKQDNGLEARRTQPLPQDPAPRAAPVPSRGLGTGPQEPGEGRGQDPDPPAEPLSV